MHIALQHAFPNASHTAEAEWIQRCVHACEALGFSAVPVVTSDDIIAAKPDLVLATHFFTPKLTSVPTLGLMWNAPDYFHGDTAAHDAILSYDGHLCGSERIAQWVDDFLTGRGKESVIHEGLMLPSSPDTGPAAPLPAELRIMYAGIHWDGSRHGAVFRQLDGQVAMDLYGPPDAWRNHGGSYRGTLPFDGVSVVNALRQAGVALCLHKTTHRDWNLPSMRLFEAASAGALIIADDFDFPRYWFRNSVLYVNPDLPPPALAQQVMEHLRWAADNPEGAQNLATRSNELFRQRLSLQCMLKSLPEYLSRVRERRGMVRVASFRDAAPPTVEYVIRVGLRSQAIVRRALASLAAQTWPSIAVTLLQFHPVEGLDRLIEEFGERFEWIRHVVVTNDGNRGTSLWAGLAQVTAEYFGILDDDDTVHANHVASLMRCLEDNPDSRFACSGLTRVHDDDGHFFETRRNPASPDEGVTHERRELFSLSDEPLRALTPVGNVIGIHAWIARRDMLDKRLLANPRLEWAEDVFLMASIASRTQPCFSGMATAEWHLRETQRDNWAVSLSAKEAEAGSRRWHLRARSLRFAQRTAPLPATDIHHRDDAVRSDES